MARLIDRVRETARGHRMLEKGDSVLVSISGGADSMALLHALHRLKGEFSLTLSVCHLNHNLRGGESRRDMAFVKTAARALGIPFIGKTLRKGVLRGKSGESLQARARLQRYSFFEEAARRMKADKIATGHTEDDQAETVLMRLLKGAGPEGLSGIPPVRGRFIRPLIEVERGEVEEFLKEERINHVTDRTNQKTDYLRNDIRLRLIPFIVKNYNPNIRATLSRVASILREADGFIGSEAGMAYARALKKEGKGGGGGGRGGLGSKGGEKKIVFDRGRLLNLHPAIFKRVFFKAAAALNKRAEVSSRHAVSFTDLVTGTEPGALIRLSGGLVAKRVYDDIVISSGVERAARAGKIEAALKVPGTVKAGAGFVKAALLKKARHRSLSGLSKKDPNVAYFDYGAFKGPLRVRRFKPGDRIIPFGMEGHKKLKEVFIEAKVPKGLRSLVPVLACGKDVLWVAGLKRSDLYRVTPATERVLKVEYRPGF